jgi:hypothetical protein
VQRLCAWQECQGNLSEQRDQIQGHLGSDSLKCKRSMSVASVKGASFYVTFIDDFSRKSWIYFMKTKDEVFSHFRAFKAQVENMTGKRIKT